MIYFILFIFALYLLLSFVNKNLIKKNGLNGPLALPLLGNLHNLGDLPHIGLQRLAQKYGNVYRIWMGDYFSIVVSDPKLLREVWVKNNSNFINRPKTPTFNIISKNFTNLAASDEETWSIVRPIVSGHFTKTKLKKSSTNHLVTEQTNQLIQKIQEFSKSGEIFMPRSYCKKYSMNIIFNILFNMQIPYDESTGEGTLGRLIVPIEKIFKRLASANPVDFVDLLVPFYFAYVSLFGTEVDELVKFTEVIYQDHLDKLDPQNPKDLLDTLLVDLSTKQKYKSQICIICIDFILAGTDTSASSIEWFMLFMANNPTIQQKVFNELESVIGQGNKVVGIDHQMQTPYLNAVIKEVLRIKPIAPMGLPRIAKESIQIDDLFIPKGTQLIQNIYSLHHDESYWGNPSTFMPERFLDQNHTEYYIPFSLGARNCVGKDLANTSIFSACANLISNFKFSSSNGQPIDDTDVFGLTIHPKLFGLKVEQR
ncbi:cytochrome P450 family protein [Cavenderia fasciculata]|uniref:Cytochrome P450 family protein n=1 Tax=Cavenderia fasciculata TaxID=261658 RepID=F4QA99_CACFS|nr:cytochrome P450 family protein [Cavenderia fasciculata]EGG15618.1 cytochrome P450 family protein [Cavenderia fasciculata]|eukprot:XP_004354360.1 cytochrome P450 family protein [Cavenderia fasciculata]